VETLKCVAVTPYCHIGRVTPGLLNVKTALLYSTDWKDDYK